jgi:ribosomal protein L37E
MLDKLDEMNDQLEEETDNMENTQMDEKLVGNQTKLDKNHNGVIDGQDFKIMKGQNDEEEEAYEGNEFSGKLAKAKESGDDSFSVDGKEYPVETNEEEEECDECGSNYMEESKGMCSECGGMMNEEGMCNECGGTMYESKKRTIKLTESELTKLIAKMVNEAVPGLDNYNRAHKESGKINKKGIDDMMADVNKNHIDVEGNDKPEFPHQIGKGEKVARKNTPEQEEEIAKNFAGLENLEYDIEPSEKFKKRLKMAIEGDRLMGNAASTETTNVKPTNGSKLGKDSEEKEGNSIKTPETAKKIEKQVKDRDKDKKERVLYKKEAVPTNESTMKFSNVLQEEIMKMKSLTGYNKKTQ